MRMHASHLGLGDCVLGQPSTDPNCFTTPAYIRALNLKQVSGEQAAGLISSSIDSAGCYDTYMTQGPNFNPDAYNRCIGAQDVTSPAFNAAAAAGVPFNKNPFQAVVPVTPPPPPPPPLTQQQVKTLSTGGSSTGGGTGSGTGNGGTGGTGSGGGTTPFDLMTWLKSPVSSTIDVPKWWALISLGGLGFFVYSRSK